jgi:putative sigma-54 modulation protein
MLHAINLCAEEIAVQVKRHRDKRRKRREARQASASSATEAALAEPM